KEASVSDFLYEIPRPFFEGRGFLLPGHIDLASFGSDLEYDFRARSPLPEKDGLMRYDVDAFERRKASFFSNLRARFKRDLAGVVDFVIIDTPPSREFLTQIALGIADYVVPVLSPGTKELDGLEDMERLMAQAWISYNPDLRIPGVLLNEAYEREVLTKHIKDELFERYKGHKLTLETIVPRSVRIAEATSNDITIFESDHPEAQRYQDVYRSVVRELNSRALNLSGTKVFSPEFFYDLHFNDSTELKEFIEEEREVANG
ncbi:MAG: ParA family protein, partial [Bdellovibrionales bacterium]|nr:ParA family protein [Bdellovibrionales bacterium]